MLDTLDHWRRRASMFVDPQAYRRMLIRAAHLLSGEDVSEDEPLAQLKERRRSRNVTHWQTALWHCAGVPPA